MDPGFRRDDGSLSSAQAMLSRQLRLSQSKALAVVRRDSVRFDGGIMRLGRISGVFVPAILWVFGRQFSHNTIARDFRDYRCGGD
jgi:hypothetical protein